MKHHPHPDALIDLYKACKLARAYLGKAVADNLMANCARPPKFALAKIDAALHLAKTGKKEKHRD